MTWNIIKLVILPFPYMNSSMRLVFCIVSNYSLVCLLQMKTSTNLFYRTSRLSRHQNSKLFWCSCGRRRYHSPSHLVWSKGSLCVTVLCTIYNGAQRYGSSYRSVNCIGLWSCLVQLSIFQAPLCLWASWCYIDIKICLLTVHPSLYLLMRPGWLTIVLQCYDTVGLVIWPISEMTYNVSSGSLNLTTPYHLSTPCRSCPQLLWLACQWYRNGTLKVTK